MRRMRRLNELTAAASVSRKLLAWYDEHRRDLPWRKTNDPYRIWLSEMMLQQTQVVTVIPYYERFTKAFPTVARLASADLRDVFKLWAGLGYYARARNMHRAAQLVVSDFSGEFPRSSGQLRELPGIGPYSAAAIASIAFGEKAAVVDGNVNRVVARLFGLTDDTATSTGRKKIAACADSIMPDRRCGDHNQAMMELGATICTPGAMARCDECPLKRNCRACKEGIVDRLPVKSKKLRVVEETHVVAAIRRGRHWLAVQRPIGGLWGGLWELPTAVCSGKSTLSSAKLLAAKCATSQCSVIGGSFCDTRRQLTHKRIRFAGFVFDCESCSEKGPKKDGARWLALDQLRALPMSNAMHAVVDALEASINNSDGKSSTSRRASSARPRRSR